MKSNITHLKNHFAIMSRLKFCFKAVGNNYFLLFLGTFFFTFLTQNTQAHAAGTPKSGTLGDSLSKLVYAVQDIPALIAGIAYLAGVVLTFLAVLKFKEHVEAPQQISIWEPVKRLVAGGALFALPMVTEAAMTAISGGGFFGSTLTGVSGTNFTGKTSAGGGLDTMIVDLMANVWGPMHNVLSAFPILSVLYLWLLLLCGF